MTAPTTAAPRPWGLAVLLTVTGAVGWWGAMALITERIAKLIDPTHIIACDVNPLVSCGTVMTTWQASLLGFPNPLLGVAGFVAPIAVGVGLLAGARFARWFWIALLAGVTGAWLFCHWLFVQAVYDIGVLCPYCMLVWAAVIPMFWGLLIWMLARGLLAPAGSRATRVGAALLPYGWLVVLVNVVGIAAAILLRFPTLITSLVA
jgi:uncharacterized membrane protein